MESVTYGCYLVLFSYNMYLQLRNYGEKGANGNRPNLLLLVASTLLFTMISAHWAIEVARVFEVVIDLEGKIPIDLYFANLADPKQIAVTGLFECEVLVGDFILIYRLYHVYRPMWWVCIIPIGCWCALAVSTGLLLSNMTLVTASTGVFTERVISWITSSFSLTLCTNVYCTGLIIIRLWRGHRSVSAHVGKSRVIKVLRIFVESAALLTICLTCTFATYEAGNNVQYGILDATSPIMGISFTLILLRLNWNRNVGSSQIGSSKVQPTYPLRSINVTVSQHVDGDSWTGEHEQTKRDLDMA